MTDQQSPPDFGTLLEEIDGVQEKFRRRATENRRKRVNSEPEERQATHGDQPEREFTPEVFLVVPHNDVRPGTATFTQPTYDVVSGDVATVTIELTNTSVATVRFGEPVYNWVVAVTVEDGNGDGTVAIQLDTSKAGLQRHDGTDVFWTAASEDSVLAVSREMVPDHLLDEGVYELTAAVDGTQTDVATLNKKRASTTTSNLENGTGDTEAAGESISSHGQPYQRPLPRRPQASPPLRSSGLTVTRNRLPTESIEPNQQYTATVTVENAGGLGGGNVTVELFANHRPATATIDTTPSGTLEGTRTDEFRVTGYTTVPPGHKVVGVAYDDPGGTLRHDNIIWRSTRGHAQVDSVGETVDDDRTFEVAPFLGTSAPSSFRFRLYWTTGIDLTLDKYYPDSTQALQNFVQVLKNRAVELADVPGTIVSGVPSNPKGPLDLASTIQDSTLVPEGKAQVTVGSTDVEAVSFDYRTAGSRGDRVLTELHARAYSLSPTDVMENWDELDHTRSRFMGRTELYWTGASAD